jgi:hypothetical protein
MFLGGNVIEVYLMCPIFGRPQYRFSSFLFRTVSISHPPLLFPRRRRGGCRSGRKFQTSSRAAISVDASNKLSHRRHCPRLLSQNVPSVLSRQRVLPSRLLLSGAPLRFTFLFMCGWKIVYTHTSDKSTPTKRLGRQF